MEDLIPMFFLLASFCVTCYVYDMPEEKKERK